MTGKREKRRNKKLSGGATPQGGHESKYAHLAGQGRTSERQNKKNRAGGKRQGYIDIKVPKIEAASSAHFRLEEWGRDYRVNSKNGDTIIKSVVADSRYGHCEFEITYDNGESEFLINRKIDTCYLFNAPSKPGLVKEVDEINILIKNYKLKKGADLIDNVDLGRW
tara:strand:+ start:179 stop:676 length:498 start_codon:yes stop_codon:yes gene_type:complete